MSYIPKLNGGPPKPDPKLLAIINSRPKPDWIEEHLETHFSPNGPSSNGDFYLSFDTMFYKEYVLDDLKDTIENSVTYPEIIRHKLLDTGVAPEDHLKWFFCMNVIKWSILGVNELMSPELMDKFNIEYDYDGSVMGKSQEYVKALVRRHDTMRFDRHDKKKRVYRMQVLKHDARALVTAYYNRIEKLEPRRLGPIAFWTPKRILHIQLKIVSSNSRGFADPKCDVVPIAWVAYLDRHKVEKKDMRICLETERFLDVQGRSFTFENGAEAIERIKAVIGERL
jgi:hypothetical protein